MKQNRNRYVPGLLPPTMDAVLGTGTNTNAGSRTPFLY